MQAKRAKANRFGAPEPLAIYTWGCGGYLLNHAGLNGIRGLGGGGAGVQLGSQYSGGKGGEVPAPPGDKQRGVS